MTKAPADHTESLADSIRRALEAAAAATDAAEEASLISEQTQTALAASIASQRKLVAVASGALGAAAVSIVLAGLVYLRSTADLREAAEIQAAASKAAIEQIQTMNTTIATAQEALTNINGMNDLIGARIDGLGDRMALDFEKVAADSLAMQPQIAASINETVSASLKQTRGEILTALAEIEAGFKSPSGVDPELKTLLTDLRDKLAKPAAPPPKAAAPKSKPPAASQKPKPKPAEPPSNFSFP